MTIKYASNQCKIFTKLYYIEISKYTGEASNTIKIYIKTIIKLIIKTR